MNTPSVSSLPYRSECNCQVAPFFQGAPNVERSQTDKPNTIIQQ